MDERRQEADGGGMQTHGVKRECNHYNEDCEEDTETVSIALEVNCRSPFFE